MMWLLFVVFTACHGQPLPVLANPLHHSGLYPQVAQNAQNAQNAQAVPVGVQSAQQPVILHSPPLPAFNHLALTGQPALPQMPTFSNHFQQNPQFTMNALHNIPNLHYNLNPAMGQNYQNGAQVVGLNSGFPQMQPSQSPWGLMGGHQFMVPSHFDVMQRLMNPTALVNTPTMFGTPTFTVGTPLYNQIPAQNPQPVAQQMPVSGYNTAQTQSQRPAAAPAAQIAQPIAATNVPTTSATPSMTMVPVTPTTEILTEIPVPEESDESSEELQQSTGVTVPPLQQSASGKIVSARETALHMHLRKAETTTSTVPPTTETLSTTEEVTEATTPEVPRAVELITSTLTAPVTLTYRKSKLKSHIAKINGQKYKKLSRRKHPIKTTTVATTVTTKAVTPVASETSAATSQEPLQSSATTPEPIIPKILDYRIIEDEKKADEAATSKPNDKPYTLVERKELSTNGSQVFQGSDGKLYTMNNMTQVKAEATVTEILSRVLDAVLPAQSIKGRF